MKSPAPGLSVVLPCYNEVESLPYIFDRFRKVVTGKWGTEIIFVNNGSTDDSGQVLTELLQNPANSFARLVEVEVNRGYGYGVMAGIRQAKGEVLAWTHADLQTPPEDVLQAYQVYRAQADMANCFLRGRRRQRNPLDAFFTLGMSLVASMTLRVSLVDVNAQPKMFHRSFLGQLDNPPDDFALDLYALYKARKAGLRFLEQNVIFGDRLYGEAKGGGSFKGKTKLARRTIAYILKLKQVLAEE